MHDAIADRLRTHPGQVDPAEFFHRFIGWTRALPVRRQARP
ncbi:hypothetical protein [Micromonospora sp. R77]|nr:hypothetical protein [Micromonospora sp. R77]